MTPHISVNKGISIYESKLSPKFLTKIKGAFNKPIKIKRTSKSKIILIFSLKVFLDITSTT